MRRFLSRLRAWMFRRGADAAMTREIASHLDLMREELERQGLDPAAARRAATLQFGSAEAAREAHREVRGFAALDQLGRDLRLAARALRRAPAFTAAAVLTLGLGLGASIAVFTVVNSVLLEPLPYPAAGELVALRQFAPGAGNIASPTDGLALSLSMFVTYSEHNHSFRSMGVWAADQASVTGHGLPQQVNVVEISDGVLQTLAVPPLLGRWFDASDFEPHHTSTLLLSYGYWRREFGADAGMVGRTLTVDGKPRVVAGVMPRGFRVVEQDADLLLPIQVDRGRLKLAGFGYTGVARLRPGATLASANADLARLLPLWMDSWTNCPKCDPHFYRVWRITPALETLRQSVVGGIAGVLWAVMGTIALVMLIAAGNVTNLFLVRAEARHHELAIRAALGAGRARIARALVLESGWVALAACGLGLGIAAAAVRWVRLQGPAHLPRLAEVSINARVVLVGILLAAAAALAAGLAPLWHIERGRLAAALGGEARAAGGSPQRRRARALLSVVQVAMALMLLLAAGLLIRTVSALRQVRPGFSQPQTVQTFRTSIPASMVPGDVMVTRTENQILDRLAALPGVTAVSFTDQVPMENLGFNWDIVVKQGVAWVPGSSPPARVFSDVAPGYFQTMGIAQLAGRDFTWADLYNLRHEVVISENLAREFWGSAQAAIGQQLSPSGPDNWYKVIGVVADVRLDGVSKPAPATVYWPALVAGLWGAPTGSLRTPDFVVRTPLAGAAGLRAQIQQALAAVNPDLPVASYRTMAGIYDDSLAVPSFTMVMLALAGGMALALGLVGVYGMIAYDVSQRRREIGIRMALGAGRGAVRRLFLGQGLALGVAGVAIGLVAAALFAQALRSLLFGVSALDPVTFLAAPGLLLAAVLLASYLPARRASRLEPTQVLTD